MNLSLTSVLPVTAFSCAADSRGLFEDRTSSREYPGSKVELDQLPGIGFPLLGVR